MDISTVVAGTSLAKISFQVLFGLLQDREFGDIASSCRVASPDKLGRITERDIANLVRKARRKYGEDEYKVARAVAKALHSALDRAA